MPVDSCHPQYDKHSPDWSLVEDVCDGRNLRNHLVEINPSDQSLDNTERNDQIYSRAVFYGVAGYTVRGLIGLVFQRWPKLTVPEPLNYVAEDVDGGGVSIYQQSQAVIREQLRKGRCGLLVSFLSTTDRIASVQDKPRAVIELFQAEDIINWRMEQVGTDYKLTLVILKYQREISDDGYKLEYRDALLELRLVDGECVARHWEKDGSDWRSVSVTVPHDAKGNPLTEIPFLFVGSETNTPSVDSSPMLDICRINVGHWNNSAEYEDSVFTIGQAQPWVSGLSPDELKNLKWVGSSALIGVPEGGQFAFAQPKENTLAREAMRDKVEMMVGLGAMFIQPGSAVKTATQSEGEQRVQHSVLSLIASNCSEAYAQCLTWVAQFMGDDGEVEYTVSQDFVDHQNVPMLQQVMAAFATRTLPIDDYFNVLKRYNLVDPEKTLEAFRDQIEVLNPLDNFVG